MDMMRAETDMSVAGLRAAIMLKALLKNGDIPAHHVSHAREIAEAFDNAEKAFNATRLGVIRG